MEHHFKKHYSRDEARALLPQVKEWLGKLSKLRAKLEKFEEQFGAQLAAGADLGGESVNTWVRGLADTKDLLLEFYRRDIQIKDLDRGLIDFPAVIGGKEVFLCWEQGEEDIEFWHELDTGYAGRERLD